MYSDDQRVKELTRDLRRELQPQSEKPMSRATTKE